MVLAERFELSESRVWTYRGCQFRHASILLSNFIKARFHPKTYAVRAFIMAARARFELTISQSKCDVLPLH